MTYFPRSLYFLFSFSLILLSPIQANALNDSTIDQREFKHSPVSPVALDNQFSVVNDKANFLAEPTSHQATDLMHSTTPLPPEVGCQVQEGNSAWADAKALSSQETDRSPNRPFSSLLLCADTQSIPSVAPPSVDEQLPPETQLLSNAQPELDVLSQPGLADEGTASSRSQIQFSSIPALQKSTHLSDSLPQIETASLPGFTSSGQSPLTIAADPASPQLPPVFNCTNFDPELGCLRIQAPFFPSAPPPILYLIPRLDFFRSNNLLLGIDPINDGLIRPTLTLLAVPPLGPNTFILASAEVAFNRYFKVPIFNYDEFRIRAGLLQRLSPTMTTEIGWTNQQLFIANNEIRGFPYGTRFLNDQAVRLELSRRDLITERLVLNSIYQFRVSFSEPEDRSRILNVVFLSLNYDVNPSRTIQLGIDYQFSVANYTVVARTDISQQLLGRVTLNAFRNSQLSVYTGFSFGNSTEPGINFNSYLFGVSLSVNLVLF